ncbi:MAG: hypothetical protein ACTSXO_08385 [Candidatus Heimdallarchaeota archaeon]
MDKIDNPRIFYLKLLAVALIIFGARLWVIHNFGNTVPYWDQWDSEAAFLFIPWLNDTLSFWDLFAPHNEHRIFFTRLQSLLLLTLNGGEWNPLLEMLVNALLSTLTAIILLMILSPLLGKVAQNGILFSVVVLWSIPYGWENILAGFQSAFYFMLLFSLLALWGLLHKAFTFKWWIGVLCAIAAYFSLASGFFILVVLIVVKLYLIATDTGNRRYHFPTLIVSIILTTAAVILLVDVPGHAVLKAKDINELMLAFGKALAWPWVTHPWFSLVLYLPFLAFVFKIIWRRDKLAYAELFVLALGGWIILQAASMAYARGAGGIMPASRYMDVLALGVIVNLLAFYLIAQTGESLSHRLKGFLNTSFLIWAVLIIVGIGRLMVINTDQIMGIWQAMQHKSTLSTEQLKHTREFMRTGELSVLQNKPYLHIPYPIPKRLATLLSNPKLRSILPHTLTVPTLLQSHQDDKIFVADGFYPITGKYQNEIVLSSYNTKGNAAVGKFESTPIQLADGFMEIPVAGYLGEKDLSLQLVLEGQAEPIVITPPKLARESWVSCYMRVPEQPFKLVAIDNRPDLWFAFAMPRSMRTLSFITLASLERGWIVFFIGISLLFALFSPLSAINEHSSKP